MKKILIIGSSGYIGRHLVKKAKERYHVDTLDILRLDETSYSIDIRKDFSVIEAYDTIIHLAALVKVNESVTMPAEYFDTNVNGTINCLKNLNYKNFVFASTGAAVSMASPYAISKRMSELIVEDYCKKNNKEFTSFRFYNVIGTSGFPLTNPDGLFSNLIKARDTGIFYLYGANYNTPDGTAIRDYLHVNEVCEALLTAVETSSNQIESLGHGIGTSVRQIIDIFKQVNNCDFEVKIESRRTGDLESNVLDNVSRYMKKIYSVEELLKI